MSLIGNIPATSLQHSELSSILAFLASLLQSRGGVHTWVCSTRHQGYHDLKTDGYCLKRFFFFSSLPTKTISLIDLKVSSCLSYAQPPIKPNCFLFQKSRLTFEGEKLFIFQESLEKKHKRHLTRCRWDESLSR